jgi:hypothetical protein
MLKELRLGLLIRFPDNIEELGIKVEKDKKDPWIDFRKGNRILSVFQWGNPLEVTIGGMIEGAVKEKIRGRDYLIKGNSLVDLENLSRIVLLEAGERDEKIINLSLVAEINKAVKKFFELRLS